jgi:hypothetical protein
MGDPTKVRVDAICNFAMFFLRILSGDTVSDDDVSTRATLWDVDITDFTNNSDRVNAIAANVGAWYKNRAVSAYNHFQKLTVAQQHRYEAERLLGSTRDLNKLTAEQAKEYLADKSMEKPIASITQLFRSAYKRLKDEGLTWYEPFSSPRYKLPVHIVKSGSITHTDRINALIEFALFFLENLSGDAVSDTVSSTDIATAATLWEVDITQEASRADKINAIAAAAGTWYWESALTAYHKFSSMSVDEQKQYTAEMIRV